MNRKLRKRLAAAGLDVVHARSGHLKVYDGGRLVASTGCTPSDSRSKMNFLNDLRRRGYSV